MDCESYDKSLKTVCFPAPLLSPHFIAVMQWRFLACPQGEEGDLSQFEELFESGLTVVLDGAAGYRCAWHAVL